MIFYKNCITSFLKTKNIVSVPEIIESDLHETSYTDGFFNNLLAKLLLFRAGGIFFKIINAPRTLKN